MLRLTFLSRPEATPAHLSACLRPPLPPVRCSLLVFSCPHSFSGEDIVEVHLPGSTALVRMVLDAALATPGVRLAEPGEFTARAFFARKLDLTQAEGIAATIAADDARQLRAAANLREGHLHHEIDNLTTRVADLLASVEAGIDFADEEDVRFISPAELASQLLHLSELIAKLTVSALRLDRLDVLPTVVFIGGPNVGKSSLINALAGRDRSMVSPIAGTTRDALSVVMHTPSGDIRLLDVPGEEPASDEMRSLMMVARETALAEADLIVEVTDEAVPAPSEQPNAPDRLTIQNKIDLLPPAAQSSTNWHHVSALTGRNLDVLRDEIMHRARREETLGGHRVAVNQRHRTLLHAARTAIHGAAQIVHETPDRLSRPELIAIELRHALDLLGEITGVISPDEILGKVFSRFCIGK